MSGGTEKDGLSRRDLLKSAAGAAAVGAFGLPTKAKAAAAKALAIDDGETRVLLAGGYEDEHNRLIAAEFGETRLENLRHHTMVLPDGSEPDPGERRLLAGRNDTIHRITKHAWHTLTVDSIT